MVIPRLTPKTPARVPQSMPIPFLLPLPFAFLCLRLCLGFSSASARPLGAAQAADLTVGFAVLGGTSLTFSGLTGRRREST